MGHHLAPPTDLAVEIIPQINTVHLQQDPMDLVVLLPLSTELHQLLLDLIVLLLPSTVLLRAQVDSEVLHLLPDMVLLRHQADLVMVLHLPDMVLLQPQADSVVVLFLHHNMVFLHLQADLAVRLWIAVVTLQVPRNLAAHFQINTALLQLSVAMVVLHHHSTVPLLLWDNLEVPLQINMELLHLAVMVALLPNSGVLPRTVDSVALFPPSMELLQRTVDSVTLLPPSTECHPLKTGSVGLLRLRTAPLHPSVVLPLLNMVHHLTVDLVEYPLPDTALLPVPADLEVVMEHLDHTLQMVDTTTLEDAMDRSMTTYL